MENLMWCIHLIRRNGLETYETNKPDNYPSEDLLDRLYKKTKSETLTLE